MLPLEGNLILGPQTPHHLQALHVPGHPPPAVHPEGVVLLVPVAQGGAEDEPAPGDDVHGRHPLRQVHRLMQRHQQGRHQSHALGLGGKSCQQRHRLELLVGGGQVVLPLVYQVEPQLLGRPDVLHNFLEALPHVGAQGLLAHAG